MDILQYLPIDLPKELNNIIIDYLRYSLDDRSLDFNQSVEHELLHSINDIDEVGNDDMYILSYNYLKYKNRQGMISGFLYIQLVIYTSINIFKIKEFENEDEIRKWIIKYDKYNITKLKDGLDILNYK